jgi:hypothetical protein
MSSRATRAAARRLCPLPLISGLLFVGCSGPETMNGFVEREARVRPVAPLAFSACELRRGRLVLEVERALVREYPRSTRDVLRERKQPLLLLWVSLPAGGPGAVALTPLVAPEEYGPGEQIRWFEGRRLLDLPARLLAGRLLDLRLAENNRTAEPAWRRLAGQIGHGVAGVSSELGAVAPSAGVIDLALDQVRQLDKDDLILRWSMPADEIMTSLGDPAARRALRFKLATTRSAANAPPRKAPQAHAGPDDPSSAELDLVFFWEPEPGCSWESTAAP